MKQFHSCLWKCIRDLCVNLLLLQLSGVVSLFQQAMLNKWRFRESAFDNTVLGVQVSSWMSEMVVDELVQCLALCTFSALLFRRRVCWISTRLYCVALASTQLS